MNRRSFILCGIAAGTGGANLGASAAAADGGVAAGEPLLAAPSENSVAVSWSVSALATGGVEIGEKPRVLELPVRLRGLLVRRGLFLRAAFAGRAGLLTLCGRDGRFRRDRRLSGRFFRFFFLYLFFSHDTFYFS